MFSEKIKKQNIYSKIILLIAAIMLATVILPVRVHAASATKTKKVTMRVGQKVQLQLKGIEPTELKWKGNNKKSLKVYKKTGIIRDKKKGTVVVTTKYDGVTYKFKVKIKKRKKNQSTEIRTETCKLKKTSGSAATADAVEEDEEDLATVKYAGLKTTATGSFAVKNIIMVGDSRTVGMQAAVGGSMTYIGKVGEGLAYLKGTVTTKLKKLGKKGSLKGKAIVFNLGVNDLGNVNGYISYMNSFGKTLKNYGATVYFMTVNPVYNKLAKAWSTVRNSQVITFNKTMAAGLSGYGIIDSYDELVFRKFTTVDGVHYNAATYKKIYNYLISCIGA